MLNAVPRIPTQQILPGLRRFDGDSYGNAASTSRLQATADFLNRAA
jgi:hypothetical protein